MGVIFGGKTVYDPSQAAEECFRHLLPTDPFLGKANSFTCPLGKQAGYGWLLLRREDLLALDLEVPHDLVFLDGTSRVTLKSLLVVKCTAAIMSREQHPDNLYVVELTDRRALCAAIPIDRAYNIRSRPGGSFDPLTINSVTGLAWTWDQMAGDIWGVLSAQMGGYPGLPFSPDGTPEGWSFWGGYAWNALCAVLDRLACAPKLDPLVDAFGIVQAGALDPVLAAAEVRWRPADIWDEFPIEPAVVRLPEKIRVRFRREPMPSAGHSPYYMLDVADTVPVRGPVVGTVEEVDDDLSALGASGVPTNLTALQSRAAERAADWFRSARYGYARRHRVYMASIPDPGMVPAARVQLTRWEDRGERIVTEIATVPWETPLLDYNAATPCCARGTGGYIIIDDYIELDNVTVVIVGGTWTFSASTTIYASFNIPPGVTPASPIPGDIWTTSTALFVYLQGQVQTILMTCTNNTVWTWTNNTITFDQGTITFLNLTQTFTNDTITFNQGTQTFTNLTQTFSNDSITYTTGSLTFTNLTQTFSNDTITYTTGTITNTNLTQTFTNDTITFNQGTITFSNDTVTFNTTSNITFQNIVTFTSVSTVTFNNQPTFNNSITITNLQNTAVQPTIVLTDTVTSKSITLEWPSGTTTNLKLQFPTTIPPVPPPNYFIGPTTVTGSTLTLGIVQVKDADLSLTDITTNNASTGQHGFAPKLPNDATKQLDGTGAWSSCTPAISSTVPQWKSFTLSIANGDFNYASLTHDFLILTVGTKDTVLGVTMTIGTGFSGPGIVSIKFSVGYTAANYNEYFNQQSAAAGATLNYQTAVAGSSAPNNFQPQANIYLHAAATGANLSALNAGSVTISILVATMP